MKIVVTAAGPELDSAVDPRFGRADYFVIVDTETMEVRGIENPSKTLGGGAGVQSAQFVAGEGVEAVLTGNCGPNAYATLEAAGVNVYTGASGTVRDAVEALKSGAFSQDGGANVASHFGTAPAASGAGTGRGTGRGMGMGRGIRYMDAPEPAAAESRDEEMSMLKQQAAALEEQLKTLSARIDQLGKSGD
ncbi:MAG: DUF5320 family protein [Planctomycetes bacterium]|nr:DUF5320 family protein [Planctomycetota bacterium]